MANTKRTEHKYKLKYEISHEAGNFTADEIRAEGKGGTDGLILVSCIEPEDGTYSQTFMSFDGNNEGKSMSSNKEFKAVTMMAEVLSRREDLDPVKREIMAGVIEGVRLMAAINSSMEN